MGFSSENGYTPQDFDTIMLAVMDGINAQFGTSYTQATFLGSGFYKFAYAIVQEMQKNEIKTSEIFAKLTDYFALTNEAISRPVATSPGVLEKIEALGYHASIKPMILADAGKISIAVDVDNVAAGYSTRKLQINTVIKDSISAGIVSQGTEVSTITLSNGQAFDFKYYLPTKYNVLLKLTITTSENNQVVIGSPDDIKLKLIQNILSRYRLGKNFEPQKYFDLDDAPWASVVKLEWSIDGGTTWNTTVYDADFDKMFNAKLENVTLVEL